MFYTVCYSIKNIKSVAENKDTKDKKKKNLLQLNNRTEVLLKHGQKI